MYGCICMYVRACVRYCEVRDRWELKDIAHPKKSIQIEVRLGPYTCLCIGRLSSCTHAHIHFGTIVWHCWLCATFLVFSFGLTGKNQRHLR